jgi:hypothetical protein
MNKNSKGKKNYASKTYNVCSTATTFDLIALLNIIDKQRREDGSKAPLFNKNPYAFSVAFWSHGKDVPIYFHVLCRRLEQLHSVC